MARIHGEFRYEPQSTDVSTPALEALTQRTGVCQDFAHIMVACLRAMGLPARYVSGYLKRAEGEAQAAGHAWAEGFIEGLGWVGFDATHKMSPDDAYVRVAAALDYLGAAPIRGARVGGGDEEMEVRLKVAMARAQSQS